MTGQTSASALVEQIDSKALEELAARVLREACAREWTVATCESCTGGLLASLLTDVEGLSHAFERGVVAYTDRAKAELLDVPPEFIADHGAVSSPVAEAMAKGMLLRSQADLAVAVTGFAGPAGPDDEPGLVYIAAAGSGATNIRELHLGDIGRSAVRNRAAFDALTMLLHLLDCR